MKPIQDIKALLVEIRNNQRLSIERQEEHIALAKAQLERAEAQIDKSIAMQKEAMARFKRLSKVILPVLGFCIVLVVYLVVRIVW